MESLPPSPLSQFRTDSPPAEPKELQKVFQDTLFFNDRNSTSIVKTTLDKRSISRTDNPQHPVSTPLSVAGKDNIEASAQAQENTTISKKENNISAVNSLLNKAVLDINEFDQDKYFIIVIDGLPHVCLQSMPTITFAAHPQTATIASRINAINKVTDWCYRNIAPDKDTHITVISLGSDLLLMELTLHNQMIAMNIPKQNIHFRCIDPSYSRLFNTDHKDLTGKGTAYVYFRNCVEMDESGQHYKEDIKNHVTKHSTANDYFNQLADSQFLPVKDREKGPVLLLSFAPFGTDDPNYLEENGPANVVSVISHDTWPEDSSTVDSIRILSIESSDLEDQLANLKGRTTTLGNVCCSLTTEGEPLIEISSKFSNEGYSKDVDEIIRKKFHTLRKEKPEVEGMKLLYTACLDYIQSEERREKDSNNLVLKALPCADYNAGLNKLKAFFQSNQQEQSEGKRALFELKYNNFTITNLT